MAISSEVVVFIMRMYYVAVTHALKEIHRNVHGFSNDVETFGRYSTLLLLSFTRHVFVFISYTEMVELIVEIDDIKNRKSKSDINGIIDINKLKEREKKTLRNRVSIARCYEYFRLARMKSAYQFSIENFNKLPIVNSDKT